MAKMSQKTIVSLIEKKERELSKVCQEIYELNVGGRKFTPIYPYVLVRVLPKEHITEGGIYLPDTAQNKPVYEGIVLSIWKPYVEIRNLSGKDGGPMGTLAITHECELKVGDRIAFPHYEGQGFKDFLDDKYYRLVREGVDQNKFPYMSVLGKIDYTGDANMSRQIRELTKAFGSVTISGASVGRGSNPN